MPTPEPLTLTVGIVARAATIGTALLRPTQKPSSEAAAAARTNRDGWLSTTMTFTEPKT